MRGKREKPMMASGSHIHAPAVVVLHETFEGPNKRFLSHEILLLLLFFKSSHQSTGPGCRGSVMESKEKSSPLDSDQILDNGNVYAILSLYQNES